MKIARRWNVGAFVLSLPRFRESGKFRDGSGSRSISSRSPTAVTSVQFRGRATVIWTTRGANDEGPIPRVRVRVRVRVRLASEGRRNGTPIANVPNPYARRCMYVRRHADRYGVYNLRNAASEWEEKEKRKRACRASRAVSPQLTEKLHRAIQQRCYVPCKRYTRVACRAPRMRNERAIVLRSSNGCWRKKREGRSLIQRSARSRATWMSTLTRHIRVESRQLSLWFARGSSQSVSSR